MQLDVSDTKSRILDVAERLMLEHGADKTSFRMISSEADVNLAAINYHFGSKENLVDAVLARYVGPIVDSQMKRLNEAEAEAGEAGPPLAEIIRSYLIPLMEFVEINPHHCEVFAKIVKPNDMNRFKHWMSDLQKPLTEQFGKALIRALADVPRETVLIRMALMKNTANAFFHTWQLETIERVYGISVDRERLLQHMVDFIAAGFQGDSLEPA